ncbi:GNAT family N-acetyltransferase [Streptomyces sp. MS2A]|nr:GNAT family N-acetyltransferase [Streptomyces sp. MS2A]
MTARALDSIEGMPSFVRDATDADLARLSEIERAADAAFTAVFGDVDWGEPPSGAERISEPGFVLVVAEAEEGDPVGFVHVMEHDGEGHLEQLSVLPDHARRGHGRALVEAALAEAEERDYTAVTLRTYADVPWNAPFYASLGFAQRPAPDDEFHRALAAAEDRWGLADHGPRVHMAIDLHRPALEMDAEAFEALVVDELDRLPDDMVDGLDNVVFVVEDRSEDGSTDLLGLYDGLAVTERGNYGMGELPDRIIVYREAHLAQCATEEELRDEVHTTLVHEIAHYYGIDDAQLHELGWA